MVKIEKFEDLEIWKEGVELTVEIYNQFRTCKDFSLRDQIQRAAVSIPANISEGFERNSNKEFIQYLFIAKGSCGELRILLSIALQVKILESKSAESLIESTRKLSAKIYKLIKTRKEKF